MNKENITYAINRIGFAIKKHSPEILVITGIVSAVAGTVLVCKASANVGKVLKKSKDQIDSIHERSKTDEEYEETESGRDLTHVYMTTGLQIVKLYAPAAILGALSVTSVLCSFNILKKRNVALAAAYATVDTKLKDYRNRVIERFGEKVDHELNYNTKEQTFEKTTTDENGNEVKSTETVSVIDPSSLGGYDYFFDEASSYWEKNSSFNKMFLESTETHANNKLRSQGYLTLNDICDMLDLKKSAAGQVVGWTYDRNDPEKDRHYVDFGIHDVNRPGVLEFNEGYERTILLSFNVEGSVLKAIDK